VVPSQSAVQGGTEHLVPPRTPHLRTEPSGSTHGTGTGTRSPTRNPSSKRPNRRIAFPGPASHTHGDTDTAVARCIHPPSILPVLLAAFPELQRRPVLLCTALRWPKRCRAFSPPAGHRPNSGRSRPRARQIPKPPAARVDEEERRPQGRRHGGRRHGTRGPPSRAAASAPPAPKRITTASRSPPPGLSGLGRGGARATRHGRTVTRPVPTDLSLWLLLIPSGLRTTPLRARARLSASPDATWPPPSRACRRALPVPSSSVAAGTVSHGLARPAPARHLLHHGSIRVLAVRPFIRCCLSPLAARHVVLLPRRVGCRGLRGVVDSWCGHWCGLELETD
jgi:hypothetical protein